MRSTPCYLQSQVLSACQSFRPVAPLFFLAEVPLWLFKIQRGVWLYEYAYDISLMILILDIWVCGSSSILLSGKSTIFGHYVYDLPLVAKMGPTPCYSQGEVVSAYQSFRHVVPFIFLVKYNFFVFFNRKGCGNIYTYDVALVTLILNIHKIYMCMCVCVCMCACVCVCGFVGLTPFLSLTIAPFFAFFNTEKGVAI